MKIAFDPDKDRANRAKHGLSLARAVDLDWSDIDFVPDIRTDYGEARFQIYGNIKGRLYVLVATPRSDGLRAISLRKANKREIRRHGRPHSAQP